MEEPNILAVTLRIGFAVAVFLVLPQALGLWLWWLVRQRRLLIKLATVLIAPTLLFVISLAFWSTEARAIAKTGTYVCGAFGAAALVATLAGTVFHLVAAAAVIAIAMGIPKAGE